MLAIVPAWKTTPTAALHREAYIPSASILLESARHRQAARIQSLDNRHPLRQRADQCCHTSITRLGRLVYGTASTHDRVEAEAAVNDAKEYMRNIPLLDLIVFSDGSKLADGRVGSGFVVWQGGHQVARGSTSHGEDFEVYVAEICGARSGLQAAMEWSMAHLSQDIHVLLDIQEASKRLLTLTPTDTRCRVVAKQKFLNFADY